VTGQPFRAVGVSLVALLLASCGGGSGSSPGPRRLMLTALATEIVVPAYERLAADADALVAEVGVLAADPTLTTLQQAQSAWRTTRQSWKATAAFELGPAAELRTRNLVDWFPVRTDRIERAIVDNPDADSAAIDALGANVKGLLALEYLLFDADGDDEATVAHLAGDTRRRQFAQALAQNVREQFVQLLAAWAPTGGNYAGQLAAAGLAGSRVPSVQTAVDDLVNRLIVLCGDVAGRELLGPLGDDAATSRPDLIATARSDNGPDDIAAELESVRRVYLDPSTSLSSIVNEVAPSTDLAVRDSLISTDRTVAALPRPLAEAIVTRRAAVEAAARRFNELRGRIELDVVSALGTTLRFNPGDGD